MYWINNESCWTKPLGFMQFSASLWKQVLKPISLDIVLNESCTVIACAAIIAFFAGGKVNTRMYSVCFCQLFNVREMWESVCVHMWLPGSRNRPTTTYFASDCFAFFSSSSMERCAQKACTMCSLQRKRKPCFCALFETETVESFCNLKQPS